MVMIPVFYSDAFLLHQTGPYHPENPQRLEAIRRAIQVQSWADQVEWRSPSGPEQHQTLEWIRRVHAPEYVQGLARLCAAGGGAVDADTIVSADSYASAVLAVSAWLDGVDSVVYQQRSAFVLVRPPGHHALRSQGMGFCLLANAAIAAYYGLAQIGIERVAILDWDVHHGNGTQSLVEHHPQIAFCSLHQYPFYPGSGAPEETGDFENVLNIGLPAGCRGETYRRVVREQVLPFLRRFRPDLLLVSAGYDAHERDPLAELNLSEADYGWLTEQVLSLVPAAVFGLEGGYDPVALGASVAATLQVLVQRG